MSSPPQNSPHRVPPDRVSPDRVSGEHHPLVRDQKELGDLLEALCEDRLTPAENARLEQILLAQPEARAFYLNYIDLHGALYWDLAVAVPETEDAVAALVDAAIVRLANPNADPESIVRPDFADQDLARHDLLAPRNTAKAQFRKRLRQAGMGVAAGLILGLGVWIGNQTAKPKQMAVLPNVAPQAVTQARPDRTDQTTIKSLVNRKDPGGSSTKFGPTDVQLATNVQIAVQSPVQSPGSEEKLTANGVAGGPESPAVKSSALPANSIAEHGPSAPAHHPQHKNGIAGSTAASSSQLIAYVNDQLRAEWLRFEITPSPKADDTEWLRRLHLDLLGHIPSATEVDKFLANRSPSKRAAEVDRLLDSSAFARNFATIWTNLLVGRVPREEVNRHALATFLRQNFARNRPWQEVVFDLVAAEGRTDQNGAANFLVAHLNGGAIPATGITSRLFLGAHLQCAQCHNHPFSDSKQEQFWAFNSFFQQAVVVRVPKYDAKTGRMIVAGIELATKDIDDPVYYETRNGLMKVAYPAFGSTKIDTKQITSRRRELARLMTQSENSGLAPAFVNRMWAHFHGRAFTPVVDDMGPHVPTSHPQLLDRLSEEFVRSGFDIKQLVRVICNSEAYQLTSKFSESNGKDNPETGETPLFSHMYVKPMSPEQLYDSLVVATQGQLAGGPTLDQSDKTRDDFLKQFVVSFETEENDEASTLNGSITQHLLMMNGDLVQNATDVHSGTWLHKLLAAKGSDTERIQTLFTSALSRPATAKELAGVKKILKHGTGHGKNLSPEEAYQDIYWALLNSNEFILNH